MAPAPRSRMPKGKVVEPVVESDADAPPNGSGAPRKLSLRRRSSGAKGDDQEVYEHLKHLGPSNPSARPNPTRINTVKIKPGHTATPAIPPTIPENERPLSAGVIAQESHAPEGGIGEGLLSSAGREASDGVHSVAVGYGTMAPNADHMSWKGSMHSGRREGDDDNDAKSPRAMNGEDAYKEGADIVIDNTQDTNTKSRSRSVSTIASLRSAHSKARSPPRRRHTARSGSISENVVDVNGIKKIVLETTSSSDSEERALLMQSDETHDHNDDSKGHSEAESSNPNGQGGSKKKRKKRGKKKKGNGGGDHSESQPLLGDGR
jgi:metal transporter CNNM